MRRATKLLDVVVEARHEFGRIIRIAVEPAGLGHDATLRLTQPPHAAKLDRLARRACADNRGRQLKDADDLLTSGHRLAVDHPPGGLADHLFHPRDDALQRFGEAPGSRSGWR